MAATAGPQGCERRAANCGETARPQELVQLADALEAPTPTRIDAEGIRPVAALGAKPSLSANDTVANCDRWAGSAASRTSLMRRPM